MHPTNTPDPTLERIRALLDRLEAVATGTCEVPGCVHHGAGREWSAVADASSW